jgi:hypothetical protein
MLLLMNMGLIFEGGIVWSLDQWKIFLTKNCSYLLLKTASHSNSLFNLVHRPDILSINLNYKGEIQNVKGCKKLV